MKPSAIKITAQGTLQFIYEDALLPLVQSGLSHIRRASYVEPTPDGQWTADLQPLQGPILGPFTTRQEALRQEVEWIVKNWLTRNGEQPGPIRTWEM